MTNAPASTQGMGSREEQRGKDLLVVGGIKRYIRGMTDMASHDDAALGSDGDARRWYSRYCTASLAGSAMYIQYCL